MKVEPTALPEVLRVEPRLFRDARGEFHESWNAERYAAAGMPERFAQDNVSVSSRGTLRGLHLQQPHAQGKLVQVLLGEVFDVVVDVRLGSPRFGRWVGLVLDGADKHQLYIPPGFAHGFCVLSDTALFAYKCTATYHPEAEITIAWNDPELAIAWPLEHPVLSARDASAPLLQGVRDRLPLYDAARP